MGGEVRNAELQRGDESWGLKGGVRSRSTEEKGILEIISCNICNLTISDQ